MILKIEVVGAVAKATSARFTVLCVGETATVKWAATGSEEDASQAERIKNMLLELVAMEATIES